MFLNKTLTNRRQVVLGGGVIGVMSLAGCQTAPTARETGNGGVPGQPPQPFLNNSAASQQQARTIFQAIDQGRPVEPAAAVESARSSPEVSQALAQYEAAKKEINALQAQGRMQDFEAVINTLAPSVAASIRAILREIASEQKTLLQNTPNNGQPPVRKRVELSGTVFRIPHGSMVTYTQKGFCMDASLPAPGQGDAFELRPVAERVPRELIPLFQAVGRWSALPQNRGSAQSVTWAIMGAGSDSPWAQAVSQQALRQMDEAMPGGARTFQAYHTQQMAVKAIVNLILKKTNLDKYVTANDLLNNTGRDAAANRQMADLIGQGQAMQDGKGVGYSMIAPNVAARATGASTLAPKVQIVNVSGAEVSVNILDYIAQPIAKKQATSATPDIFDVSDRALPVAGDSRGASPNGTGLKSAWLEILEQYKDDLIKFAIEKGLGWLTPGTPAAANAVAKEISRLSMEAGIPRNIRKPLVEAAASLLTAAPVVGNVLSLYEAVSGKNWYTGEDLNAMEHGLAVIGTIPGANALRAVGQTWKLSNASRIVAAGSSADPKNFFRLIDSSQNFRDINGFVWSGETQKNAREYSQGSVIDTVLTFNKDAKDRVAKVLAETAAAMPWNKTAKDYLKSHVNTGHIRIPGIN